MLTYLRIRDLALIDDLTLEWGPGLTVLTGETGAGKSILLDALALAAGQRAALEKVRAGADEAVVEAAFELPPHSATLVALAALADDSDSRAASRSAGDRPPADATGGDEEEGTLVVRRVIGLGSRGARAFVNDRLTTVSRLREIGRQLVDFAGQHESQRLLRPAAQRTLLDRFASLLELVDDVADAFNAVSGAQARLDRLQLDDRERAQRADYLRFRIGEIVAAELRPGEYEELAADRRRLRHADELRELSGEALSVLYEQEGAAVELLGRAQALLERLETLDPEAVIGDGGPSRALAALAESRIAVEELSRGLQAYAARVSAEPARLEEIEQRLMVIEGLRRKYADGVDEILVLLTESKAELAGLDNRDEEIERTRTELVVAIERYDRLARELSAARRAGAAELAPRITAELQELGMAGAALHVEVSAGAKREDRSTDEAESAGSSQSGGLGQTAAAPVPGARRSGYDTVELLLAANPGEPPRPLTRVASGGELSRVLLALKLAVAHNDAAAASTLVFDEIDAGIGGGGVAECLAARLAELATSRQVLLVTHLPQIAAAGARHLRVTKGEKDGRTAVQIESLEGAARVEELARMLGGVQGTDSVRQHARDLLGRRE